MATTSSSTRLTTPKTRRDCRLRSENRRRVGGGAGAGSSSPSSDCGDGPAGASCGAGGCGTNSTPLTAARSRARCLDHVAGAADGVDELRLGVVDLLAQVADVQLDDVGLALEVILPDPVEDLRLRQHDPLVTHEVAKQLELGGSQVYLDAGPGDLVAVLVQFEIGDPQDALTAGIRRRAAQHRV